MRNSELLFDGCHKLIEVWMFAKRFPLSKSIVVSFTVVVSCLPCMTIHVPSFRWEGAIYPSLQNIVNQDHSKLDLTVTSQFFCQDIQVSDTLS